MLPINFFGNDTFGITVEQAALTASFYTALYQEQKSARFQEFKELSSVTEFDASKAAVSLLHLARELFSSLTEKGNSLNILVDFLQEKLVKVETNKSIKCECQVTVFSSETGGVIERYPQYFDDSCRQLWLYGKIYESKIVYEGVISNISTFSQSSRFGTFCFYCQKYFSGKGSKHRCRKRQSCFSCHRPLLKPDTYVNQININLFCNSKLEPKLAKICLKCNLTYYSTTCEKIHFEKVCRWGWFCLKCKQYTFRSKYFKTRESIQEKHNCLMTFCIFCGEQYVKNEKKTHLCRLFKLKPSETYTKLAFLQMSFRGSNAAWCSNCTTSSSCLFCMDNIRDEIPNLGVLLLENKPGHFDSYTFADIDLYDYVSVQKREFIYSHFENLQPQSVSMASSTGFQPKKVKVNKNIFAYENGVMGQILNFILQKDFSNITLVINCSDSSEPYFFISELLKKGLGPKVLKHDNRILLVECQEIGLRIIDSQNYITMSLNKLSKDLAQELIFFPRKWNKKSCYNYVGQIPSLNDFLVFDDTSAQVQDKRNYVANFHGTWNLKETLRAHTKQKVEFTAQAVLDFICSSFEMQKNLHFQFSQKSHILHPLKRPLLTFAGFAYNLFLIMSQADIRMVKKPIEYNSSKGEVELAQFLEYVHQRTLEHAWSPYGQTKQFLPVSIPDIYDKKMQTLFYYNGCFIHEHSSQNCKFRGKKRSNQMSPNSQSFDNKMKKLACYSNVKKIKVVWQCGWVKEKRENPFVKHFMQSIYTNPPTYRLDCRCAGEISF